MLKQAPKHFQALSRRGSELCVWVFDLLELMGEDTRPLPLVERRKRLKRLVQRSRSSAIALSEAFRDPTQLLGKLEELGIDGIVSKREDAPYRAGRRSGWIKIKTSVWREVNRERWRKDARKS